jgi:hypothetical protein
MAIALLLAQGGITAATAQIAVQIAAVVTAAAAVVNIHHGVDPSAAAANHALTPGITGTFPITTDTISLDAGLPGGARIAAASAVVVVRLELGVVHACSVALRGPIRTGLARIIVASAPGTLPHAYWADVIAGAAMIRVAEKHALAVALLLAHVGKTAAAAKIAAQIAALVAAATAVVGIVQRISPSFAATNHSFEGNFIGTIRLFASNAIAFHGQRKIAGHVVFGRRDQEAIVAGGQGLLKTWI